MEAPESAAAGAATSPGDGGEGAAGPWRGTAPRGHGRLLPGALFPGDAAAVGERRCGGGRSCSGSSRGEQPSVGESAAAGTAADLDGLDRGVPVDRRRPLQERHLRARLSALTARRVGVLAVSLRQWLMVMVTRGWSLSPFSS